MSNQIKLGVVAFITIVLSGFLIWQGLNYSLPVSFQLGDTKLFESENISQKNGEQLEEEKELVAENSGGTAQATPSARAQAKVLKVVDGDTIDVELNGKKENVRFIGIDTPETVDPRRPVQCFGKEASDENKRLLEGKVVELEKDISETDKYNRLLRYIFLKLNDGSFLFVNDYLVRQGFALSSSYPPDIKYQERFNQAQKEAYDNKRGLWGSCK